MKAIKFSVVDKNMEAFDDKRFSDVTTKSLRNLTDWLLAIPIGIFTISLINHGDINLSLFCWLPYLHKLVLICSLIAIAYAGYFKYIIFSKTLKLNNYFDEFRNTYEKIKHLSLNKKEDFDTASFNNKGVEYFKKRDEYYNTIKDLSLLITKTAPIIIVSNVLLFGAFIIIATW